MNRLPQLLLWLATALLPLAPVPAAAATVAELQADGRLGIKVWTEPADGIVPGQKVNLLVEVATDRWFTSGTRIALPEVAGLVILQTEQFASNASEQRNGQNWVLQRWTLDVYPQRAGDFVLPPFAVTVSVSHDQAGDVEGDLMSPALRLSASLPEALAEAGQWVAAPEFEVTQSFDRPPEQLQVGDAVEREIQFRATDTMAMMLPDFEAERMDGLAAYPSPATLENQSNRGVATARRVERISYIAEAPGSYRLPEREYFWWDTRTREVRLLSLPATTIEVSGEAGSTGAATGAKRTFQWKLPAALVGAALLAWLLVRLLRRLPPLPRERLLAPWHRLRAFWRELREPALPEQLNPDSNAAD